MQGKKDCQEQLFTSFQLSNHVPKDNFYRRLSEVLDLRFLYKLTEPYYGDCGQKSIDPVVFYKLCLVGYLENIISDRKLIDHCSMRMDILFFLAYDIDEPLPWHSTISRTRQLSPEDLFEKVFTEVLKFVAKTAQSKTEEVKATLMLFFDRIRGKKDALYEHQNLVLERYKNS
jgi:transposase